MADITEDKLIDYLYGELEDDEREAVEAYLDANPERRRELEGLRRTRRALGEWEDEDPTGKVVFVTEPGGRVSPRVRRFVAGGVAAAAAVLLVMFGDFEIGMRDGRFHFVVGSRPARVDTASEVGVDRLLTVGEFASIQGEYFELTRQLVETSELRQQQALMQLKDEISTQRARDLQFVGQGIRDVARTADYNIEQTGVLLNHVQTMYRQP